MRILTGFEKEKAVKIIPSVYLLVSINLYYIDLKSNAGILPVLIIRHYFNSTQSEKI